MLEKILRDLGHPEYVHLLLNPLPIYGSLLGSVAMLVALFCKSPAAKIPPLVILLLAGLVAWPVQKYGHKAESRVENQLDHDGREWFETHEHRAEKVLPLFYLMAGLAAISIVGCKFLPKSALPLGILMLLLGLACTAAGAWIGYAGGKIMHRELRTEPPPPGRI